MCVCVCIWNNIFSSTHFSIFVLVINYLNGMEHWWWLDYMYNTFVMVEEMDELRGQENDRPLSKKVNRQQNYIIECVCVCVCLWCDMKHIVSTDNYYQCKVYNNLANGYVHAQLGKVFVKSWKEDRILFCNFFSINEVWDSINIFLEPFRFIKSNLHKGNLLIFSYVP